MTRTPLPPIPLKRIILEPGAGAFDACTAILDRLPHLPVSDADATESAPFAMDKKSLRLISFPGQILKPCPGTREYICCDYHILHVGTNCPLDCSYCILQGYFNQPSLRVFVNLKERLQELDLLLDRQPGRIFRIGTGEFTDSLAMDPIARWSETLLPFFSRRKNAILELKTKTDRIRGLLQSAYRERIIVSWSLNSPFIAATEEHGAPPLEKRLRAAARCQKEGFALGFHFDPMIHHRDWRAGYQKTVELMDKYINPRGIIWMSLGALRFMPHLKSIIRRRHPRTAILDGEFIPGLDGKMRYFKPIRLELFSFMAENLSAWHRDLGLYLCMESDEAWTKALGWSPGHTAGLSRYLDRRVTQFFP